MANGRSARKPSWAGRGPCSPALPTTAAARRRSPMLASAMPVTANDRRGYQWVLTALLSLNFGLVLFDRNALSFLMPFVQPELGFTNTQVGVLAGGLSLTWALSAFGAGIVADRFGSRK